MTHYEMWISRLITVHSFEGFFPLLFLIFSSHSSSGEDRNVPQMLVIQAGRDAAAAQLTPGMCSHLNVGIFSQSEGHFVT